MINTFPTEVVRPEEDPRWVQGLDVGEVETQDRKAEEKVWMNVAHFGEMVDWASAVSLHLPLYRITLTI